jgi:hypothetical protein
LAQAFTLHIHKERTVLLSAAFRSIGHATKGSGQLQDCTSADPRKSVKACTSVYDCTSAEATVGVSGGCGISLEKVEEGEKGACQGVQQAASLGRDRCLR